MGRAVADAVGVAAAVAERRRRVCDGALEGDAATAGEVGAEEEDWRGCGGALDTEPVVECSEEGSVAVKLWRTERLGMVPWGQGDGAEIA